MKNEPHATQTSAAFQSVKDIEANAKARMEKVLSDLQHEMASVRTGRASVNLLDNVRADYYGKVRYRPDNATNDEDFGAKILIDVDLGYHVTKDLMLSVGADNLLNTFPDAQIKDANISFGRFIYSRNVTQFGQNGGFYYAKLQLLLR